jgi:hypothetical protein
VPEDLLLPWLPSYNVDILMEDDGPLEDFRRGEALLLQNLATDAEPRKEIIVIANHKCHKKPYVDWKRNTIFKS